MVEFDQRLWKAIQQIAYQKTYSLQEAEDLVHDVFLDLWNNRKKINISSSLSAYIFSSLKYKIFRWIDACAVRRKHAPYLQQQSVNAENNADHTLSFNELYHLIEQGIENLPPKCQTVFKLSREEQLTVKEISDHLQISPNTAQNHINKALRLLRQQVDAFFFRLPS